MAGGGSAYDDRVVRARLAQAFGRLIRRQGDCGTFVILSAAMPSRLLKAFPPGVPIHRLSLDEAIARVQLLPGTGRRQSEGLTEGALRLARTPLHHASHGPPPRLEED
jgi:ATP-dependent DNA helicase DinG